MIKEHLPEQLAPPRHNSGDIHSRLWKGMGANLFGQVINLSSHVLLVPLFLTAWGVDIYGEWLLLSSFVAYLALTDLGGQLYIVNRLTQAYTEHDIHVFRKVLHTGLMIFVLVPGIVFSLFILAISMVSLEPFLRISRTGHQSVFWVLALLAFQFTTSLPQGILLGVYRAIGWLPRGVMLGNYIRLLQLVLVASGLWLGLGMVWIAGLQVVPLLLVAVVAIYELNSRFPEFDILSLKEAELSTGRTFIKPSLHFFSIQAAQALNIQGIVLVVGVVLGPVQLVVFSTLRTVVNVMRQLLALLAHTTWPEITRLDTECNTQKLFHLMQGLLRTAMVAGAVLAIGLHFYGAAIYRLWLGEGVEYQQSVMDLFLIYGLQQIFWSACGNVLMATNRHHVLSKIFVSSAVLAIALSYVGSWYYGLHGAVLGLIVADLMLPCWAAPYLLRQNYESFTARYFALELFPIILGMVSAITLPWSAPIVCVVLVIWWSTNYPMRAQSMCSDTIPGAGL